MSVDDRGGAKIFFKVWSLTGWSDPPGTPAWHPPNFFAAPLFKPGNMCNPNGVRGSLYLEMRRVARMHAPEAMARIAPTVAHAKSRLTNAVVLCWRWTA
jgi:hypothetical protein